VLPVHGAGGRGTLRWAIFRWLLIPKIVIQAADRVAGKADNNRRERVAGCGSVVPVIPS